MLSFKKQSSKVSKTLNSKRKILPSKIYRLLEPFSHEATLLLMAMSRSGLGKGRIMEFFHKYNGMRTSAKGDDIKALGIKAGPHFAKIMEKILYRKLDGILMNREEEIEYAKKLAKRRL